jgi:hypothetical protein
MTRERAFQRIVWLEDKIADIEYIKPLTYAQAPSQNPLDSKKLRAVGCSYPEHFDISIGYALSLGMQ